MISTGQNGVIYCDPPWQYEMYSDKGHQKSPQQHYDCMDLDQLKAMRDDVLFATAENSVCIMWSTFAFLDQALDLMKFWGFKYKTGGPWIKRTVNGKNAFGTGYVLRSSAEIFLIGTIGKPVIKNRKTRNIIMSGECAGEINKIDSIIVDAQMRQHSRKPDAMIHLIESLFDGPYIELFSRTTRDGWECWGNQTDKF